MGLECDNCGTINEATAILDDGTLITIDKHGTLTGHPDEHADPTQHEYECPECGMTALYIPDKKKQVEDIKQVSSAAHWLGKNRLKYEQMLQDLPPETINKQVDEETQRELEKLRKESHDNGYDATYAERVNQKLKEKYGGIEIIHVDENGNNILDHEDYKNPEAYKQKLLAQKTRRDAAK